MRRFINICLACLSVLTAVSCQDEIRDLWQDNENPVICLLPSGERDTVITWNYADGFYNMKFGVSLGGVRPERQTEDIRVDYIVDSEMIDEYNNDITRRFSGEFNLLPSDCYTIDGDHVVIGTGNISSQINVKFDVKAIAALPQGEKIKYVLPLRLTNTSKYALNSDKDLTRVYYVLNLREPMFYFFNYFNGVYDISYVLTYGAKNSDCTYLIAGTGVPDGNYKIDLEYDAAALAETHPWAKPLPQDAYTIVNDVVYQNARDKAALTLRFDESKMAFQEQYYLPLTMVSTSSYMPNPESKTIYINVSMRNEYEKKYFSEFSVSDYTFDNMTLPFRFGAYGEEITPATISADTFEMPLTNTNTVAGSKITGPETSTYAKCRVRIKVIPTDDKTHYKVEYIPVATGDSKVDTPFGFEASPDEESYYNWMDETFYLYYRWKHIEKKDTSWVVVRDKMTAV